VAAVVRELVVILFGVLCPHHHRPARTPSLPLQCGPKYFAVCCFDMTNTDTDIYQRSPKRFRKARTPTTCIPTFVSWDSMVLFMDRFRR
jgi:hypothetical protein